MFIIGKMKPFMYLRAGFHFYVEIKSSVFLYLNPTVCALARQIQQSISTQQFIAADAVA
jgi:hypothetical protein